MKTLNEIYDDLEDKNVIIQNVNFNNKKSAILKYKDTALLAIDYSKFNDSKEEKMAVAEESEHYNLGTFYKFNSPLPLIDKMEYKTVKKVYNKLIPFEELKEQSKNHNLEELSEYFEVPIKDILKAYFLYTNIENFAIM